MSKKKLYVYTVHQEPSAARGEGYRILGIYLDKDVAEKHREVAYGKQDRYCGYISVTKHAVRGGYARLGNMVII